MNRYIYDGPVLMFGRSVGRFHGETVAASEDKARSNLEYQYKKKNNKIPSAKFNLPGKIIMED